MDAFLKRCSLLNYIKCVKEPNDLIFYKIVFEDVK